MRSSWLISGFLCLGVLTGCGGGKPTEDNYAKVKAGMSTGEVESILGRADNSIDSPEGTMKMWDVAGTSKKIAVTFNDGKVQLKDFHE